MDEAYRLGGFLATGLGFLDGTTVYTAAFVAISRKRARHRKRPGHQQQSADEENGLEIAVGALLDGIPESVVIGVGLPGGACVSVAR